MYGLGAEIKNYAHTESLSKTRVFEKEIRG
jgi:hypothetical protein